MGIHIKGTIKFKIVSNHNVYFYSNTNIMNLKICNLISEIYKYLDNKIIFEILIIDDCSTDNTIEIINNLLTEAIFNKKISKI